MRSALRPQLIRPALRPNAAAGRVPAAPAARPPASRAYSGPTYTGIKNPKPPVMGQPLAKTHAHLVREGELTPGVTPEEYEDRRRRLMESLPAGAVVVCMGGTVRLVSQQIFYKFRQSTDFFYLTGFDEPDATVVLGYKYILFVPPRDRHELLWSGERTGVDEAVTTFGADEAYPNSHLSEHLSRYLGYESIYASLPPSPSPSAASQPISPSSPRRRSSLLKFFAPSEEHKFDARDPPHLMLAAALAGNKAKPLEQVTHRLRVRKSDAELRLMKKAADISGLAHKKVIGFAKVGGTEAQIAARFEYECALNGSERPAYVPVVASGANSLVIHYTRNDCVLDENDMVLIDAGGEFHMYASDITRTFPVNGRFTDPQRDLYQAVLNVQKECVKRCVLNEGVTMNELHRIKLRQIGFTLSTGDVERKLYPHFLTHHVGSDLHDCPSADRSALLQEGNVLTIEPGVYVPFDDKFPKHFQGLGVRIEDEVAMTNRGPWVLTELAPKEIRDVEAAAQAKVE
ncbi:X-Pro aminopeptidase [Trichosporon asahii var. asahii CBS 2479]|uniref:X-Pro aminopeptidase n=1 Tax=Trichosporon asahii var. asahii (strain ATCC 90039 / CBS 2479 / JCM 2466 / KCTC 7840 / NBRC 103889/ NCYC 2677 / UAMH 7654) TaxID=1186058 RepID=J4U6D0_TRIAS|nr:X-Pro aminopeptidase [Trichosporon asahii var. asahii CBS 2479]EJT45680.1 X-Pro aminopeptidase [Trichosporon asahii var. asahii CBS 2479]